MTKKQRSIYFGGSAVLDRITDYCIGKALFHAPHYIITEYIFKDDLIMSL